MEESDDIMLEKWLDPTNRLKLVQEYKDAGMGGQRYGVVCPNKDCHKRICPQGIFRAQLHPDRYCQCPEQYEIDSHESIYDILEHHGLDPAIGMTLNVQPNMHEATKKKKKG